MSPNQICKQFGSSGNFQFLLLGGVGSSVGQDADYPDLSSSWRFLVPGAECQNVY
jgi:hypothetical protein